MTREDFWGIGAALVFVDVLINYQGLILFYSLIIFLARCSMKCFSERFNSAVKTLYNWCQIYLDHDSILIFLLFECIGIF